jgi:hypothetical protein
MLVNCLDLYVLSREMSTTQEPPRDVNLFIVTKLLIRLYTFIYIFIYVLIYKLVGSETLTAVARNVAIF